ncbi:MAG: GNAT family N-acetyltransferase [Oscillospiraceae bacterium]|nr:GNAT family N-acetyltransferase [Oscillospiraceae bacterium]
MQQFIIEDYKRISEFLNNDNENSCEDTFINLLVWQKPYETYYEIYEDCLIIRSFEGGDKTFRLPFGRDFEKGFSHIVEQSGGKMPKIWSPDGANFKKFKELYADKYEFIEDRDGFDYLYLRDDLVNLSGKKYHSKRNHIAAFSKAYDWRYESISNDNKAKIIECLEEWYQKNSEKINIYTDAEKTGIFTVLDNLERLNVKGGAIFVGEKAVAFSLGSPINSKTFNVYFEKALPEYSGAYSVINREFAKYEAEGYTYINREDDMGIEGLRRAKLSYKPYELIKKYLCIPKTDKNIKSQCYDIYKYTFEEDDFSKELFDTCFEYCKYLIKDGTVVSILFLLPCEISVYDKLYFAKYVFAVATHPDYRGKGYMNELINSIKSELPNDVLFLKPVNESLTAFYNKLGFDSTLAIKSRAGDKRVILNDEFYNLSKDVSEVTNEKYNIMYYYKEKIDLEEIAFADTME